jgi:predicted AAA+ superfamily ATPase
MPLKPWHTLVTPREDLREGRPLDAAEFAVHLDKVRDGTAPAVYQDPRAFFERTFLTENLAALSAEVARRLSGMRTETNAVINLATQFGGGKTHALTLLYHLATRGVSAGTGWPGASAILAQAGVTNVPQSAVAVFVGTEFDSLKGRGGSDGTPLRMTPWGEIAYQLGGDQAFAHVAEHDRQGIAPGGDVLRTILPTDRPCLILMDELLNYVSRFRKRGLSAQLYDFLQNLSETARGLDRVVLAVSIPASELEMSPEDHSDHERFKTLLDRLGKAYVLSGETETSEIIRRRLFEWDLRAIGQNGRVQIPADAVATCKDYALWMIDHRQQLPHWFPLDRAEEVFRSTFPFHPSVISVFERKWRSLPRFQQTRGVLRLLALWVSRAYDENYRRAYRDPLVGVGSAPLDDALFRAAVFEQLGESRFEAVVTTDICGKPDSHATRLDAEVADLLKKQRVHRKVASAIFYESQSGASSMSGATVPEIRLAVAEPDLDIGNVETALDALATSCYYLTVDGSHYRFGL